MSKLRWLRCRRWLTAQFWSEKLWHFTVLLSLSSNHLCPGDPWDAGCRWISELEPLRLRGLKMFGEQEWTTWTHQLGHWAKSASVHLRPDIFRSSNTFSNLHCFILSIPDIFQIFIFLLSFDHFPLETGTSFAGSLSSPSPRGTFHASWVREVLAKSAEKFRLSWVQCL